MSPQQARGEPVDKQADIWAFGCILFEMLSGRQTWSGRSATDIIAVLVAREPDWSRLPSGLHSRIRFVLERCLEKEVEDRYRDIAEARVEISKALADPGGVTVKASSAPAKGSQAVMWVTVAAAVVGIAAAGGSGWYWYSRSPDRQPVARFSVDFQEMVGPTTPGLPPLPLVAVSRDGTKLALSSMRQISLRNLGESEARPVQGAAGQTVFSPAFSPDGQWLAYVDYTSGFDPNGGSIRKIPVSGGTPQTVARLTGVTSAANAANVDISWDDRNMITWARPDGIMQVSANGGEPQLVVRAIKSDRLASPQILPGGKWILFTATTATGTNQWDAAQIVVQSIGASDRAVVWRGGRDALRTHGASCLRAGDDSVRGAVRSRSTRGGRRAGAAR
jgi:Protein tyrosine and serine/threonine kinase/WD40-like Beta Propeller Repeat